MPFIASLYQTARERNILAGIIIIDLISFISYIIFPTGIIYFGDFQLIIGCIIGTRFALRNIKSDQSFIIYGVIVGLGGSILTGISFTMYDWVVYYSNNPSMVLISLEFYLIEAIIIGLLLGFILGAYYNYKNIYRNELSTKDEKLLKDLIER